MRGLELLFQAVLHRLVGAHVPFLTGKKAGYGSFVILIGLDAEIAAIVPIGHQRVIQLLDSERHTQVFGVAVPDVVYQSLEEPV